MQRKPSSELFWELAKQINYKPHEISFFEMAFDVSTDRPRLINLTFKRNNVWGIPNIIEITVHLRYLARTVALALLRTLNILHTTNR
jgi:hypothetical protein